MPDSFHQNPSIIPPPENERQRSESTLSPNVKQSYLKILGLSHQLDRHQKLMGPLPG